MAEALKLGILDLSLELLTHTLIFLSAGKLAGAVSPRSLKPFLYGLYHAFIGVENNLHNLFDLSFVSPFHSLDTSLYSYYITLLFQTQHKSLFCFKNEKNTEKITQNFSYSFDF